MFVPRLYIHVFIYSLKLIYLLNIKSSFMDDGTYYCSVITTDSPSLAFSSQWALSRNLIFQESGEFNALHSSSFIPWCAHVLQWHSP